MGCNHTILIVNDDIRFRMVIKEMILSKYPKLKILGADTIKGANNKAKHHHPELIILDMDFGLDKRFQLIRDLKSSSPNVKIIALSGYDATEYKQAVLENGADHFLSKFSAGGKQIIDLVEFVLFRS
jgi:DNA-binding NarL/FixJ family response regulator